MIGSAAIVARQKETLATLHRGQIDDLDAWWQREWPAACVADLPELHGLLEQIRPWYADMIYDLTRAFAAAAGCFRLSMGGRWSKN
jgi:hypothetical protein